MLKIVDADKKGKLEFNDFLCMIKAGNVLNSKNTRKNKQQSTLPEITEDLKNIMGLIQTLNRFSSDVMKGNLMQESQYLPF